MVTAQHTSNSSDWHTPAYLMDMVREVLGSIDYDPYSNEIANKTVQAKAYSTEHVHIDPPSWGHSIFCNPPSRLHKQAFADIINNPKLKHAIFLVFNLQQLQVNQDLLRFPLCIPAKRISYVAGTGVIEHWTEQVRESFSPELKNRYLKKLTNGAESPPHASGIVYVHGTVDKTQLFSDVFSKLGRLVNV